jgi:hypothetical protein
MPDQQLPLMAGDGWLWVRCIELRLRIGRIQNSNLSQLSCMGLTPMYADVHMPNSWRVEACTHTDAAAHCQVILAHHSEVLYAIPGPTHQDNCDKLLLQSPYHAADTTTPQPICLQPMQ